MEKKILFIDYDDKYAEQCHINFLSQAKTAMFALWRPTRSAEEAKSKLNYWKSNVCGNGFFWLIQDVYSENIIGFVSCDEIETNIYGNIGIFIGEQFINKGFGSQTLNMLIKQIKKNDGKEIHYSHFKENEASKKLALKHGFKYLKTQERIRQHDGKLFEELFYVLKIKEI